MEKLNLKITNFNIFSQEEKKRKDTEAHRGKKGDDAIFQK